ncbi:MAG: hypothetical protein ACO3Q7_13185 [Steroidobacteraceae bacterium]
MDRTEVDPGVAPDVDVAGVLHQVGVTGLGGGDAGEIGDGGDSALNDEAGAVNASGARRACRTLWAGGDDLDDGGATAVAGCVVHAV